MILRWKNGDILQGKLVESAPGTVRWSSPQFLDDLILNPDVLDSITFARKPVEPAGPFRMITVDGSVWTGELAGVDGEQFSFLSPSAGILRIKAEAVYSIDYREHENLLFDGSSFDTWLRGQAGPIQDLTYTVYPGRWRPGYPDFRKLNYLDQGWLQAGFLDLDLTDFEDLFAMVFEGRVEALQEGDYMFAIDVDDQARLSIDGKKVLITESGGSETVRLFLSTGFHRIRLEYLEYGSGEHLNAWWSGPGFADVPLSGHNTISGWRRGPAGFPETYREGAFLFRQLNFSDRFQIDLELFSSRTPHFVMAVGTTGPMDDDIGSGFRLEMQENELFLLQNEISEKVLTIEKDQQEVRIRCVFDCTAGSVQVLDADGRPFAELQGIDIQPGSGGLSIRNLGENLQIRRMRICRGDINQVAGTGLLSIDNPKVHELVYSDGTIVRGSLERIGTDHLVLRTAVSEIPIGLPVEGAVSLEFGTSSEWGIPGSGNSDLLLCASGPMHGELVFGLQDAPMAWKPEGAEASLRTGRLEGAHIERSSDRISTESFYDSGVFPHLLHLKNGEVFPCQVFSFTADVLEFQSPLDKGGNIHPAFIKAIEFSASAHLLSTADWSRKLDQWLDEILVPEDETYLGIDPVSLDRALMLPRFGSQDSVRHLLLSKTGDVKRGKLLEINDRQVLFESNQHRLSIPIERLACVVDVCPMADEVTGSEGWARFFLSDGSNMVMMPERSAGGMLAGHSPAYGEAEIPIANIERITFGESEEERAESRFKQWLLQPSAAVGPADAP